MTYFFRPNQQLKNMLDDFFAAISRYNDTECDGRISVLLLGSLSKGEGSWIDQKNGAQMLSDVEFFVVYPDDFAKLLQAKAKIGRLIQTGFSEQKSRLFHVDATFVSARRLQHMEHKLLTYDAACCGKWVVGKSLQHLLPKVTIKTMNFYDIRDIVEHRIFSVLSYGLSLKEEGEEVQYRYVLAKNSLDLMTALLVQNGRLASSLTERATMLKDLVLSQEYKDFLTICMKYKTDPQSVHPISISQMEAYFLDLAQRTAESVHVPFDNALKNARHRLRRRAGQIKRMLRYRHFICKDHQKQLLLALQQQQKLTPSQRLDHLVLHGYPAE